MKLDQEIKEQTLHHMNLNEEEIPNTIIADNTGRILMQRGQLLLEQIEHYLESSYLCLKIQRIN